MTSSKSHSHVESPGAQERGHGRGPWGGLGTVASSCPPSPVLLAALSLPGPTLPHSVPELERSSPTRPSAGCSSPWPSEWPVPRARPCASDLCLGPGLGMEPALSACLWAWWSESGALARPTWSSLLLHKASALPEREGRRVGARWTPTWTPGVQLTVGVPQLLMGVGVLGLSAWAP